MTAEYPSLPVKRALPIIRVFVSSTFSDLKHERNALHAKVWPELERYCQQRADHLRFASERAPEKMFVGRSAELRRIRKYLLSDSNQPYVVHGPSGSGNTALMGRAILKLKKIIERISPSRSVDGGHAKTGPIVLTRFIGTTPESSNLRSLLSSLCRELRQDFEMTAPLPTQVV